MSKPDPLTGLSIRFQPAEGDPVPGGIGPAVDPVQRPIACPQPGQVAPFDAGWDAHRAGLARDTVAVISPDPGWALLGWDARHLMAGAAEVNRMFE